MKPEDRRRATTTKEKGKPDAQLEGACGRELVLQENDADGDPGDSVQGVLG